VKVVNKRSTINDQTSNTSEANEQIAVWVGLDWADKEHSVSVYEVASSRSESYTLKHTAEALQDWLLRLRAQYSGSKVAVVLEQSRGPVLYALMSCEFIVLYPVNPQSLANYRKAFQTSGSKNDPGDAQLLSEMVRKHPDRFRAWVAEDPDTRSLQLLVEGRRKLVNQMTKLTNRLTSHLKNYYPQALEWAGELNTRQACDFLKRWPTLDALQQTRPATLKKFYLSYGRPRTSALNERLEKIKQAVALTRDRAVVLAGSMMVQALVAQIRSLITEVEKYDDEIHRLFQQHPDRLVFESFTGAGRVLAPRLLAAMGADRDRWQSAAEIQQLSGIAPVTEQSGKQHWVHRRWGCPKFLLQTFHEFAKQTIVWCDWAKAYYEQQRERGKGHHTAVRALAYKWIRIVFACWKNRVAYDETLYVRALERRGSKLAARTQLVTQARELRRSQRSGQSVEKLSLHPELGS
jgi:transposase